MRIALCQNEIVWEDKNANISRAKAFAKKAAEQKADIVFFPEMSFTGFSSEIENTKEIGESAAAVKKIAVNNNIAIGFGWVKDCGDRAQNVYTVVDNRGEVMSNYVKIHPFSYSGEDISFISGSKIVYFNYKGFNIGTLICYDLRFPEIFQALSKNADLIVVPACWPQKRSSHWKILLKARAIENQCYIAGINCVGDVGGIYYSGDSSIIDPDGKVLCSVSNEERLVIYDINCDAEKFRKIFPTKKDRKTDLYRKLI